MRDRDTDPFLFSNIVDQGRETDREIYYVIFCYKYFVFRHTYMKNSYLKHAYNYTYTTLSKGRTYRELT